MQYFPLAEMNVRIFWRLSGTGGRNYKTFVLFPREQCIVIKDNVKKKYMSHSILEKGPQFVVSWEIDGRHILTEETSSCPIPSSGSQGVPTLAPPCKPCRQRGLSSAACPLLDFRFSALCLNLTAWLSRGLLPLTHLFDLIALTRCNHPVY